ncbi:hypothetical protein [Moheibacter sediminis]|uniref:TonB protein C-terminal n=1 Tax=Moheibacter sediminis TaxID=1434700 RepID=A0A1W1YIE3_9FLAO|nr:hypothetical protein [Moheibacter sediminis]SMC35894.1 hypothetical protein SAMN06296427_101406 [Moheibacter sediminis]
MKKFCLNFVLILFTPFISNAQEKPYIEYERPKYSTGPYPKISPIFPGCEIFKENNDLLDRCFGVKVANKIAEKLEMEILFDSKTDSASLNIFRTKVIIDIKQSGKLEMKLKERVYSEFENQLVEKLNAISDKTTGIIPAKLENNYCSVYRYQLPIMFDLTEWNEY